MSYDHKPKLHTSTNYSYTSSDTSRPTSKNSNNAYPDYTTANDDQCLSLDGIDKWPFGESSLVELIVLRQEQERTKQEQIRLQNLERTLQVLKVSIEAKVPSHMIANILNGSVSSTTAADPRVPTPPNQTMMVSSPIQNPPSYLPTAVQQYPKQYPPIITTNHQRSSTISTTKELYYKSSPTILLSPSHTGQNETPINHQYITHNSPFKFPKKLPYPIPESQPVMSFQPPMSPIRSPLRQQPKTKPSIPANKNNETVGMSSFQGVIQFHHWQSEDPGATIRKEQQKSSSLPSSSDSNGTGHSRQKSNPELLTRSKSQTLSKGSKIAKPTGAISPTKSNAVIDGSNSSSSFRNKRKVGNHSRAKSEIVRTSTINDFGKFQVGRDNILNSKDAPPRKLQPPVQVSGPLHNKDPKFNPLNNLVSAAMMETHQSAEKK
ncbi:hypothetical protein DASC09_019730 [Saccharomycopsis crataegensis]|uniref:Uncharacterized protein n=1 Tax=Saccharomycopsis crataegensis TaxID=43959 RepID=A0AAV5QKH7_9ASCO|nr:hypothetical protein DASC09_019730 [Saccharomycopsis crataegensis]